LLILALSGLGWLQGARATPFPASLVWLGAMTAYGVAVASHARRPLPRRWVWGVGLALRVAVFPLAPHYSDDIYRYLWDGWVQTHGVNPFLHAPASPALAGLRTEWWPLINHPDIATIYPPAAQLVFWSLATLAASVPLFKLSWLAADLVTAWMVDRIAVQRSQRAVTAFGAAPGPAIDAASTSATASVPLALYLWSPLLVLEVAWSGHLEPLGMLPMVAAVWVLAWARDDSSRRGVAGESRKQWRGPGGAAGAVAGSLLGIGAAIKFAPAAALPALARRRGFAPLSVAALVLFLSYFPFLGAGAQMFSGLGEYAERWAFNAGPFRVLDLLIPGSLGPRMLAAAVVVGVAAWAAWRGWTVARTLFWTLGAALVLSPTLHPWYVLWILPFAALERSRAWILFTGTVFFAYWGRDAYQLSGVWPFPWWLSALVWLPFGVLLVVDGVAAHRLTRGGHVAGGEQPRERGGGQHAGGDKVGDRTGQQ
jgi:hypothetical protein